MRVKSVTDSGSSHILMLVFVAAFSMYFYHANSRQRIGKKLIEGTVDLPCFNSEGFLLMLGLGRISIHLLKSQTATLIHLSQALGSTFSGLRCS